MHSRKCNKNQKDIPFLNPKPGVTGNPRWDPLNLKSDSLLLLPYSKMRFDKIFILIYFAPTVRFNKFNNTLIFSHPIFFPNNILIKVPVEITQISSASYIAIIPIMIFATLI